MDHRRDHPPHFSHFPGLANSEVGHSRWDENPWGKRAKKTEKGARDLEREQRAETNPAQHSANAARAGEEEVG